MWPLIVAGTVTACASAGLLLGSVSVVSGSLPTATITLLSDFPQLVATSTGTVVQPSAQAGGWTFTWRTSLRLTPHTDTSAGWLARTPRGKTPVM